MVEEGGSVSRAKREKRGSPAEERRAGSRESGWRVVALEVPCSADAKAGRRALEMRLPRRPY